MTIVIILERETRGSLFYGSWYLLSLKTHHIIYDDELSCEKKSKNTTQHKYIARFYLF